MSPVRRAVLMWVNLTSWIPMTIEQPGQRRGRNLLGQAGERQGEDQHPHAVQDRRCAGLRAGGHVGRAAHDHTRDRKSADSARGHIGGALADQLTIQVRPRAILHAVHCDRCEQAFHAGDQRDGDDARRERPPVALRQTGRRQGVEQGSVEPDAGHVQREEHRYCAGDDDGDQRAGDLANPCGDPAPRHQDSDHQQADGQPGPVGDDQLTRQFGDVAPG